MLPSIADDIARGGWTLYDYRSERDWPRAREYDTRVFGCPANKSRARSRGLRRPDQVSAVMLHTTAVSGMHGRRGLGIPCHASIGSDESVTLCHHADRIVYHGHAANRFSYGIEISGDCDFDAASQITRGRLLLVHFRAWRRSVAGDDALCYVMAHRQSHSSRVRDPGPVIWRELGQWAIDELGYREGPVVGSGRPIPDEWRR